MRISDRIGQLEESATFAVTEKAARLKEQGVDVVSLTAGEPDFDTPEHIKDKAILAIKSGFTKYTASSGIAKLREAIARKLKRDNNLDYKPSDVLVSCGAKHSLYNIIQAICNEGDEVIVPAPYWTSYPEIIKASGAKAVMLQTHTSDRLKLTPNAIKKHITNKTKAILLNSPSNPTGAVYYAKELEAIAEVLSDYDIFIISDEIYESIIYDGLRHISIASINNKIKEKTIVINGVSKAYAMTGWRIGYAVGPKDVINVAARLQSQSTSNPSSISQYAAVAALDGEQSFIGKMVKEYENRRNYIINRIKSISNISYIKPEGAFYFFIRIADFFGRTLDGRTISDSMSFSECLLEHSNVATVAGVAFGADEYVRLSFSTSMDNIIKGLDRFEKFLKNIST